MSYYATLILLVAFALFLGMYLEPPFDVVFSLALVVWLFGGALYIVFRMEGELEQ